MMVLWDKELEPSAAWLSILTGSVFSLLGFCSLCFLANVRVGGGKGAEGGAAPVPAPEDARGASRSCPRGCPRRPSWQRHQSRWVTTCRWPAAQPFVLPDQAEMPCTRGAPGGSAAQLRRSGVNSAGAGAVSHLLHARLSLFIPLLGAAGSPPAPGRLFHRLM